jgi:hypothetical protein
VLGGKVAIISGTASSMAAMARMFAREGAKLVIADVLEHEGRQVADAIGASARFEPLDATKEEGWAAEFCARHLPPGAVLAGRSLLCLPNRLRLRTPPAIGFLLTILLVRPRTPSGLTRTGRGPPPSNDDTRCTRPALSPSQSRFPAREQRDRET